jgi:hypothetical protein
MNILVDFSAKVDREDIFKPTMGPESLYEINIDNGVIKCWEAIKWLHNWWALE